MFERLTMRRDNEVFINSEATGWTHKSHWSKPAQEAIDRLAAYEDIGLSPDEITDMIYRFEAFLCEMTGNRMSK